MVPRPRKQRVGFTIDRDIRLLRLALWANPWQTGKEKWTDVVNMMEMEYNIKLTTRTVSGRINKLRDNFRKQLLRSRTGTEEQETERSRLLSDIEAIIADEDAAVEINNVLNDETDDIDDGNSINDGIDEDTNDANGNDHEHADDDAIVCTPEESDQRNEVFATLDDDDNDASTNLRKENSKTCNSKTTNTAKRKFGSECPKKGKKSRIAERNKADAERKKYVDEADEPVNRRFQGRMSVEDEMLMKRQDHEIEMDKQRLELEKERLELDKRREMRLDEEARRRDELHMAQLLMQQSMMALIGKMQ